MKTSNLILVALASAAVLISGCHSGAYAPKNTTKYDLENQAQFVDMDSGTQKSVTCSGIQQAILPDGRLRVKANLRNRENRRIQVQVSCVFKDEQGFSTGDETPWANVILTENAQEGSEFTSMNNLARRYTIRVRQAR